MVVLEVANYNQFTLAINDCSNKNGLINGWRYTMSEYFYLWQDFPMSKKDDRNKDWHIQTTSKEIARVLVQRNLRINVSSAYLDYN